MAFNYKTDYYRYKRYFLKVKGLYQQPAAKTSLALILTLLAISFFSLFAIKPTFMTIGKLVKEIKDKQSINKTLAKKVNDLEKGQINLELARNDFGLIDKALPLKADFNRLAGEINYLILYSKLILSSASFSEFSLIPPDSDKNEFDFNLVVDGDFSSTNNFIKDLENLDRILEIKSISFSTKTEVENAKLQADISGKAFFLSQTSTTSAQLKNKFKKESQNEEENIK